MITHIEDKDYVVLEGPHGEYCEYCYITCEIDADIGYGDIRSVELIKLESVDSGARLDLQNVDNACLSRILKQAKEQFELDLNLYAEGMKDYLAELSADCRRENE